MNFGHKGRRLQQAAMEVEAEATETGAVEAVGEVVDLSMEDD